MVVKQFDMMDYLSTQTMIHGDCLEEMRKMADNSIDFIVTDSPYGISFMSKAWDQQIPPIEYWQEMLRICKPGSMMACAGLPRMYHRLACVVEDAGWLVRDCIMHFFGSGFPKSLNIGKAIDKDNGKKRNAKNFCKYFDDLCRKVSISNKEIDDYLGLSSNAFHFRAWNTKEPRFPRKELYYKLKIWLNISDEFDEMIEEAEREIIGKEIRKNSPNGIVSCGRESELFERKITLPKLELSKTFNGYGTALKPAYEPWLICMKPLDGTFAQNAEKWGVAGINIDESRIEGNWKDIPPNKGGRSSGIMGNKTDHLGGKCHQMGRWPSNLILSESAAEQLDKMTGVLKSGDLKPYKRSTDGGYHGNFPDNTESRPSSSGGASRFFKVIEQDEQSRFFYCPKSSTAERNKGLEGMPLKEVHRFGSGIGEGIDNKSQCKEKNIHPTVKPIALMKYILKLLAPPGNPICLDPFAGSGSTLLASKELGINCIGIEKELEYFEIAQQRIKNG